MTTQQNYTHRKRHHTGDAPFSRFIDELLNTNLGDAIESVFIANRALVNVLESESAFEVHVAAPGLTKSDFKLEVKEGILHISASHTVQKEEGKEFRSKEFDFSNFHRTFRLDERVDAEKIIAKCEQGVLVVTLPKHAKEAWKKEIHVD